MLEQVGEFFGNLMEVVCENLYTSIYSVCSNLFDLTFVVLNQQVGNVTDLVGQDLESWNASVFSIVKTTSENIFIPIGGAILIFVFTWEISKMIEDNNLMQNIGPEKVGIVLLKLVVCLYVMIHSFDIVMFIYSIGNWAAQELGETAPVFGVDITLDAVIPAVREQYNFLVVFEILGVLLSLLVSFGICFFCGIAIYLQVLSWFIELSVYAVFAPIPFSTFINRDWGQTGMNYGKKIFALGLRGFLMFFFMIIYGGLLNNLPSYSWMDLIFMTCGGAFLLLGLIFKSGNIVNSILNAH